MPASGSITTAASGGSTTPASGGVIEDELICRLKDAYMPLGKVEMQKPSSVPAASYVKGPDAVTVYMQPIKGIHLAALQVSNGCHKRQQIGCTRPPIMQFRCCRHFLGPTRLSIAKGITWMRTNDQPAAVNWSHFGVLNLEAGVIAVSSHTTTTWILRLSSRHVVILTWYGS